jgi:hypothetical protein
MYTDVIGSEMARVDAINAVRDLDLSRAYRIEIKQYRESRSTNQNNLFQKWMRILGEATGYSRREMEEFFEEELLEKETVTIACVQHEVNGRFKDLNTKEFSEAMDQILMWVAENMPDVRLPLPNDGLSEAQMKDAGKWG